MTPRRGFTLIELLIVVAIMAILSAAAMAVVIGPLGDTQRSEAERQLNTGFTLFHTRLVIDLHQASEVRIGDDGDTLEVIPLDTESVLISYSVDEHGVLRRSREGFAATPLVPNVQALAFSPGEAAHRLDWHISAGFSAWHRDFGLDRGGTLTIGPPWRGRTGS